MRGREGKGSLSWSQSDTRRLRQELQLCHEASRICRVIQGTTGYCTVGDAAVAQKSAAFLKIFFFFKIS